MKKRMILPAMLVLAVCLLSGCCLSHEWQEATCETPKTCAKCEEVEGEALGHSWEAAACETPETCKTCGKTQGEALGHTWQEATCETPMTCSACAAAEGEALGHDITEGKFQEDEATGKASYVGLCQICAEPDAEETYENLEALATAWVKGRWEPAAIVVEGNVYAPTDDLAEDYFAFEENGKLNMVFDKTAMEATWKFLNMWGAEDSAMLRYVWSNDTEMLTFYISSEKILLWEYNGVLVMYAHPEAEVAE